MAFSNQCGITLTAIQLRIGTSGASPSNSIWR
jgi:hypothetical protein